MYSASTLISARRWLSTSHLFAPLIFNPSGFESTIELARAIVRSLGMGRVLPVSGSGVDIAHICVVTRHHRKDDCAEFKEG
jgi:hypothetical protein